MHDNFCVTTQNGTIYARDVIKYIRAMIDFKLTWKTHIQYIVKKVCVTKGILNKTKCLAHAYLYYGITSWGNAASIYTHKIQVQLNNIIKIITRTCTSFFKTRLFPLYIQFNLMKLEDIYELEVLQFVDKFIKNSCSVFRYLFFACFKNS